MRSKETLRLMANTLGKMKDDMGKMKDDVDEIKDEVVEIKCLCSTLSIALVAETEPLPQGTR